jgi:hypothetical protein
MTLKPLNFPKADYYMGCDPGYGGAYVVQRKDGEFIESWPMPIVKHQGQTELNAHKIAFDFIRILKEYNPLIGVEWNSPRAFQNAGSQWKFALQHGILQAMLDEHQANWVRVAPQLWKGRLGLPGKVDDPHSHAAYAFFVKQYGALPFLKKPRGGLHDGVLDAALIAHFLRVNHVGSGESFS